MNRNQFGITVMADRLLALLVAVACGAIATIPDAASAAVGGKDRLTGAVAGVGIHPLFGALPFTDLTLGASDGVTATGGGLIRFDFTGAGLGVVAVRYDYTCLSADDNVSTHRFVVRQSTNPTLAPVGATGISSVIDAKEPSTPDTDRVLLFAPPPPPQGPCSREDRALLDSAPVVQLTVTAGNWSVHDGLPDYP
jgi:hypothetical protein